MGDNEEGRPKLHERGSGLQVEGMPRPGKTTQGQELRRSASMRKSFKMVKNFWRQFEGPRTDPPRRRIIRTIEPEGPPPPPERPILRPIPRPTKGEVRGVDSEPEEESSRRSNAKGLIRTSQMQGKKPSTLRSFGPSRASHLSKHPSHRFARTPLPESIKEEPEDEHQTQPEGPILRPIARPTKGEIREVDSEAEEESSRRSNAKGRTSRPSPDTGPIRTSQGRRPSQTSQVQGKKPSTLRSMGPSRVSHLSKHPSDRFLRTLLPESIKEEPEDEHQTQEARHMDAASTEEEGIPSDDALLQEDLASFFEGSEDGNLERMAHSGFLHRSGVAEDTRRTTRTLRGEGEGVPPPPPPPIPPPPPPVLPPTFMQQPSFGRVPFSEVKLKRPSIFLPVLLDEEKHFHELVASGNLSKVQDFLERRPDFNINCTNHQGVSALHIAVERGDEEMTEYLLADPRIEAGDTHLFAIRDGRPVILRLLLDRLQAVDPSLEYMAISGSAEFPETLTPLILAAESGHYDVISMLLDRGHRIPLPHPPRCFCKEECQVLFKTQDPLTLSTGKLHIYRAISNPAYICQTSEDPFLTAFLLSRELKDCGDFDVIYLRQYEDLAEAVRLFAVDLIAECRSVDETEIILSERKGFQASKLALFPRLIMAVDFKQKEFVAHPNVQKVLERAWRGDWLGWVTSKKYAKVLYVLPRMVMLPVILCLMMFAPTSTWARHYALPVNKLLSSIASYSVFLLLIFVQSNIDKAKQTRDTKPSGVEIFLLIYIIAFIYNSVRSIILETPKRYFSFMWNIHEVLMELLFVLTFIFWITAAIRTTATGEKDVERKYWKSLDPELIAEGLFVLAAIMAYVKILLICQMSYDLGPLQVSLGKMMNDCALYSVIFAIILLAFTVGLCKFYSYYVGMYQKNPETGEIDSKQEDSFVTILDTFKTLFWGIFGMSSYEVADVVIEPIKVGEEDEINEHLFTEAVGYLVFAVFMVLSVTIILNMLVATMSNTYQAVRDNVDTEWAFGRTENSVSIGSM